MNSARGRVGFQGLTKPSPILPYVDLAHVCWHSAAIALMLLLLLLGLFWLLQRPHLQRLGPVQCALQKHGISFAVSRLMPVPFPGANRSGSFFRLHIIEMRASKQMGRDLRAKEQLDRKHLHGGRAKQKTNEPQLLRHCFFVLFLQSVSKRARRQNRGTLPHVTHILIVRAVRPPHRCLALSFEDRWADRAANSPH